jgi:hypothetical protein
MMLDINEHECTDQEDQLLAHMEAGEWSNIGAMKDSITKTKSTDEEKAAELEQFDTDYNNAYQHYQENALPSDEERHANLHAKVQEENAAAEVELESTEGE